MLGVMFSWLPDVETLPTIGGYDIDGALVLGMGQFNSFIETFWAIGIMFQGFLFIAGYFAIKMVLQLFLGHRTPH